MNEQSPLAKHLTLVDDLHRLALEENRILKAHGRLPGAEVAERKRAMLARLDESLTALRGTGSPLPAGERILAEQAKARMLQFLHLDRENEQLLLRCSLGKPPGIPAGAAAHRSLVGRTYVGDRP